MVWVLVVLMIVPEGFDFRDLATADSPVTGSLVSRLTWLALLGLGLVAIVLRARLYQLLLRRTNVFLMLFVLLAASSVLWSLDPQVTARRMIRMVTIISVASAFVLTGWHALRLQNVLRPAVTVALLGSLAFGLGWPDLAIHHAPGTPLDGAWHGLASHKNGLGDIACIGLVLWFHAWRAGEVRPVAALLGSGVALACLVLSQSSTSLVATVGTLLMIMMLMHPPAFIRRHLGFLMVTLVVALVLYSLVILRIMPGSGMLLGPIGALTGKDMTFTGRTEIWDIVTEHVRLNPVLGSGYGAYWVGPIPGADSYDFVLRLNFYPASAHNGYLDILNDLGVVGLFVLFAYLAVHLAQSLRLLRIDRDQAALYLALFLQQAVTNMSESRWLNVLSVDFVIMTLATLALARTLLDHAVRESRPSGAARPA
jgi:O-antigen ligase